ncbi:sulfotransferase family 2 domain-containing protein [Campylobacter canadensis]|uniref:sulfotransferase family 2 domain-containing protein n=1 Tax=Campylobacter canadensis TaxID=449520 RepID=UPI001CD030CB|nr:sulfotransferase family 2 domain-containing protein [Campylobacter canadensis]MBZ8002777.1 sulfotransferase family 2 domain-containing protein [Campylobacter canadensis]
MLFKDIFFKENVLFIHIPKNAGTSIEKSIYNTNWLVGHTPAIRYFKEDENKFLSLKSFAFVRNPYDRFISAFFYLKDGGAMRGSDLEFYYFIKDTSFSEFCFNILNNEEYKNKVLSHIHFREQYKFVCNAKKEIIVNFIGKYEKIAADFLLFTKIYLNKNIFLPHLNRSKHEEYLKYYQENEVKAVNALYKEDFLKFNYKMLDENHFATGGGGVNV